MSVCRLIVCLFVILATQALQATTFRKIPLAQLIEESSSAAEVKLIQKRSYMNKIGMIFTEHTFQVLEPHNLQQDVDGEILKLDMTGGTVNGVTSYIDGAPEFAIGEKSFLLLKKIENKLYLSNFTLGKYKILEENGETYYQSSVFPSDPDMGKVSKERMVELVRTRFGITSLNSKNDVVKSAFTKKGKEESNTNRKPAQSSESTKENFPFILMAWIFFTFSLSAIIGYHVFKKGKI